MLAARHHQCASCAPLTGKSCPVRSRRVAARRPHIAPVASSAAQASSDALGTWRDDVPVAEFVKDKPALEEVVLLHEQCLQACDDIARATGGPLKPQPTRHAPDAKLSTKSLDGNNSYILCTYTGGAISHLTTTLGVVPAIGLLYAKITAHAAMEFGTPFLNIELTSLHKKSVLVCALPDPRLYWLLHPEYLMKYWRTPVEIGPRSQGRLKSSSGGDSMQGAAEALSFEQLERRVRSRMPAPKGFSAPPPLPPGSPPPSPPLYEDFHSASLYTRLAAAFGVLFTFDAANAQALEAARDDVHAVLSMWKHWVVTDCQGESLQAKDLEECRAITAAVARFLQYDPDVGRVEKLLGTEVTKKMLETVSGEANLEPPWWMQ